MKFDVDIATRHPERVMPPGLLQHFEHAANPFTGPWLPCGKEAQNATV